MELDRYPTLLFTAVYMLVVSAAGVFLTAYDKAASKKSKHGEKRIPENTLMYLGALGGALPMYVTMRIIRHKTKHKKFMIGLPVFAVIHAAAVCAAYFLLK